MVITNSNALPDKSSPFVHGFVATEYDLAVLAQHYLDDVNETYLDGWLTSQFGSMRFTRFPERRLQSIDDALGCDALDAAVESTAANWRKEFKKWKNIIRCSGCEAFYDKHYRGDCQVCGSPVDSETARDDPWDPDAIWLTCR